jgi:hypothetical protein
MAQRNCLHGLLDVLVQITNKMGLQSIYNEKTHAFTEHLADVFQTHPSENEPEQEEALTRLLEAP